MWVKTLVRDVIISIGINQILPGKIINKKKKFIVIFVRIFNFGLQRSFVYSIVSLHQDLNPQNKAAALRIHRDRRNRSSKMVPVTPYEKKKEWVLRFIHHVVGAQGSSGFFTETRQRNNQDKAAGRYGKILERAPERCVCDVEGAQCSEMIFKKYCEHEDWLFPVNQWWCAQITHSFLESCTPFMISHSVFFSSFLFFFFYCRSLANLPYRLSSSQLSVHASANLYRNRATTRKCHWLVRYIHTVHMNVSFR